MPSYFEIVPAFEQFVDGNGNPVSGGKLYTYTAGTSSPKTTYQESNGSTPNTNPIVLDSSGYCPYGVWGTTGAYKLILTSAADVTLRTRDNVSGINDVVPVGWTLLSSQTASNSSSIDFTQFSTNYNVYKVEASAIVPVTDNVSILMRTSSNAGSSYDSAGADYHYADLFASSGATTTNSGSTGASAITITSSAGNSTGENVSFTMTINGISTTLYKHVYYHGAIYSATPTFFHFAGSGMRASTAAINAVRFLMSSGNISSGTFKLFGMREA